MSEIKRDVKVSKEDIKVSKEGVTILEPHI